MAKRLKDPLVWLHGLLSALITGLSTGVLLVIVKPETFNLYDGWDNLWKTALVMSLVGTAAYLKQSPLPPLEDPNPPSSPNPPRTYSVWALAGLLILSSLLSACSSPYALEHALLDFTQGVSGYRQALTIAHKFGHVETPQYRSQLVILREVLVDADAIGDEVVEWQKGGKTKEEILLRVQGLSTRLASMASTGSFGIKNSESRRSIELSLRLAGKGIGSLERIIRASKGTTPSAPAVNLLNPEIQKFRQELKREIAYAN